MIEDFELEVKVLVGDPMFKSLSLKSKRNRLSAATTALWTLGFKKEDFPEKEWKQMITKVRSKIKSQMASSKFYAENSEDVKKRSRSKPKEPAPKRQRTHTSESQSASTHDSLAEESDNIPESLPHPALSSTLLELPSPPAIEDYDPSQPFSIEHVQIGSCIAIAQEPSRGIKYGKVLRVRSFPNNDVLVRNLHENDDELDGSEGDDEWEKMSFIIHPDIRLHNGSIMGKNIVISRYNKFKKHWFSKKSLSNSDINQLLI